MRFFDVLLCLIGLFFSYFTKLFCFCQAVFFIFSVYIFIYLIPRPIQGPALLPAVPSACISCSAFAGVFPSFFRFVSHLFRIHIFILVFLVFLPCFPARFFL